MNAPAPTCPDCGQPMGRRAERCRACASRRVAVYRHTAAAQARSHRLCPDCGAIVSQGSTSGRCHPCAMRARYRPASDTGAEAPDGASPDVAALRRERDDAVLSRGVLYRACQELKAERDLLRMQNQGLAAALRRLREGAAAAEPAAPGE